MPKTCFSQTPRPLLLWVIMSLLVTLCSCINEQEEILRMAQIEYERKIEVIKRSHTNKCREEVIWAAEEIVDSLILLSRPRPLTSEEYAPTIPNRPTFVPPDTALLKSKNIVKPVLNQKGDEE